MADAALDWGGDLTVGADGDILLVDGADETRERIIRRLLTPVRGYVWHPEYGAGLPQRIGRTALAANIRSIVLSQIRLESTVARVPVPVVTVAADVLTQGLFNITIQYVDTATGAPVSIDTSVSLRGG